MRDEPSLGLAGRLARFFVASRLTPLVAGLALLAGVFAILATPREEEPQIDVTMANVIVPFPGASAADVERLVAMPAEQVLARMPGLEHVWSVSQPGLALVTVQFKVGVPRNDAVVRLHDTILSNRDWLPPELGVGEPVVKPKGIEDVPIVAITLHSADPGIGAADLERVAHAVEGELKRVAGTREVSTIGGPGREVRVEVDAARLAGFGLDVPAVRNALKAANASAVAGDLVRGNATVRVDAGGFLASAEDVRNLVMTVHDGKPVYLSDVARVVDGPPPPARIATHWPGRGGGADEASRASPQPAVTIQVTKNAGENAVDVAARVERRVAELRDTVIPPSALRLGSRLRALYSLRTVL